jgi:ATP-dependent DNA ligase
MVGGQLVTSAWTVCESKNSGKTNETTDQEQALKEARAIWDKKKLQGKYHEDVNAIDTKFFFEPMLAKDWNKEKSKVKFPLFSQPKLDGIRCIVRADGMWSRNGKQIISAPHIFEILKPLFEINPDLIFDGELYADKFANDFNAICSLVKKTKPTGEDLLESAKAIQYHIYDLPSYNAVFTQRYKHLHKMLTNYHSSIIVVTTDQIDNMNDDEIYKYFEITEEEIKIIKSSGY